MRLGLTWMAVAVLCCAASASGQEQTEARRQEAQAAYDEALKLQDAGRYAEAVARARQALALREALPEGSPAEAAQYLNLLGRLHRLQGEYAQAEPLLQRGLALREAALGRNHPDVADSLNDLGLLYFNQGLYGQAEPFLKRGLAIREVALGKNHPSVAASLNNLANLSHRQGVYGRAEQFHKRALAIKETALGKNHLSVASTLNNLGDLYRAQGLYAQAAQLHMRALVTREAALGKDHPQVAQSLNNLAIVYKAQGLYAQAEPLYQRALAIWEAALGKDHPDVADALDNLGLLYSWQGLYSRAEPLLQRALAIQEASFGKEHPNVADSLVNIAIIHVEQGLYGRAEPLYQRALAIQEAALGKEHALVALTLNNLANIYLYQGLYGRAEPLYQRALAIREAALGGKHSFVADSLHNLAILYVEQGLYGRAEPLHARALTIREATLGRKHPNVADSLNSLGDLYWAQGLYGRAEPFYQRALTLRETAFGKHHPSVTVPLNNLALRRLAQNRLGEAIPLFMRAFTVSEQRLRHEALDFSEERLAHFLHFLRNDEQRLYALLREHPDNARVRRLVLGAALLLKGRSVEEMAGISRAVYRSLGTEEHDTFERLRGLRTQRAMLSLQGPGSRSLADYQHQLQALAGQGDALEADLARRSAPLRALTALPSPADIVDRVAAALPKDGALVEFISYEDRPLLLKSGMLESQRPRPLRYLALVLLPDASTRAIDLGPAEPIDAAASGLRDALANRDAAVQAKAQAVYQLAFHPLLPLVGKAHRLFLSPEGQLALVPFAALHDGKQFLVERFDFTYLTSGKELLPRLQEAAPADSVVVLADPDFGAPLHASATSPGKDVVSATRSTALERFFSTLREDALHRDWAPVPLPGTRQEAEAIQHLFPQARLFLGPEATKEELLHLPTPGILHLATHGFFLGDAPAPPRSRALGHFGALGEAASALPPADPLLRSGLLLAGADAPAPDASSSAEPPLESGLVTALELAGLNLWGTQLVVLSACDTGRGDIKLGQGVYGLRRALVVAGAETVVMSLWKVEDTTTQELMEAYYRNLLAGQGRATALREAMRWLRTTRPEPHAWAPFIVLGRDTPLRGLEPPQRAEERR